MSKQVLESLANWVSALALIRQRTFDRTLAS